MKSVADLLPPEFAALVHPDWRKNEADYWNVRDQLLEKYRDQWIGFADGVVVASGKSAVQVLHVAKDAVEHPFCTCVGRESEPDRIRPVKSLSELLPPEIVAQLHPDLLKNEAAYWAVRDQLLAQYHGQWIGFADGQVVASGELAVNVHHEAQKTGRHPHVTCVGHEFEAERIRRVAFPYDTSYGRQPLPVIDVEFRAVSGVAGPVLNAVIPDTGADASALPWSDFQRLQLNLAHGAFGVLGGIGGSKGTVVFDIWVFLDGQEYRCRVHADLSGTERILGREVLNQLEILFRGPSREVVVNP